MRDFFKLLRKLLIHLSFLIFRSVTTEDDEDDPKEPFNNDVPQSKYFKFSIFMKF